MPNSSRTLALTGVLLFSLCVTPIARADYEDPPGRVARLNDILGEVSYSPAGEDDWIGIQRNRPLIRGDRLWTDRDARAEFQVGNAAIRLGPDTSFGILNLNDDVAQLRLTQGTINLRVRRIYPGQTYEVATPTLAFVINRAGRYRIDVDPYDDVTTIVVWEGAGVAYGDDGRFALRAGDTVRFYGTDLRDYEMYGLPRPDDFDRYSLDRDQRLDRSVSLRYVDDDMVGYSDLDDYGDWRQVGSLGVVWFPRRVDNDWAPYRDGHWAWQEPWGWTWIDDAPWGFAPSHYGRWVHVSNRWGWIPGPRNVRPVYSPALVAFIGGSGWSRSISSVGGSPIGWFPLGPREIYVPSYRVSRDYFTRVNANNTVVNNTTITNVYNNYSSGDINISQVNYVNRRVAGAVIAVPTDVFVNARPVRTARIRLDSKTADSGEITHVAAVVPSARSVLDSGAGAKVRPSREAAERQVTARHAPPPAQTPFAAREPQLKRKPGQAPETSVAESAPNREVTATRKVRVIDEQRSAVDVRAAGTRSADGKTAAGAGEPAQLQPLDRSVKPGKGRGRDQKEKQAQRQVEPECDPEAPQQNGHQPHEKRGDRTGNAPAKDVCKNRDDEAAEDVPAAPREDNK